MKHNYYNQLTKALHYTFTTREDFERKIDENPLDWQNHLVYADWLEDHDDPHEAEFRRNLADWIRENGNQIQHSSRPDDYLVWKVGRNAGWPKGVLGEGKGDLEQLKHFEYPRQQEEHFHSGYAHPPSAYEENAPQHYPSGFNPDIHGLSDRYFGSGALYFRNYRGLENALRRAYYNKKANRDVRTQTEQGS